ncbi:MAG: hypothetical protein KC635_08270, partial [Myxococcales bacterium]|nr:hypothetical protein [Myxococcales bacterium]
MAMMGVVACDSGGSSGGTTADTAVGNDVNTSDAVGGDATAEADTTTAGADTSTEDTAVAQD